MIIGRGFPQRHTICARSHFILIASRIKDSGRKRAAAVAQSLAAGSPGQQEALQPTPQPTLQPTLQSPKDSHWIRQRRGRILSGRLTWTRRWSMAAQTSRRVGQVRGGSCFQPCAPCTGPCGKRTATKRSAAVTGKATAVQAASALAQGVADGLSSGQPKFTGENLK